MKSSRNVLQDQLVVLSIDIEDKSRLCELLKKNIAKETNALHEVESSITEHFETLIQNELNQNKSLNEDILQKSNSLVTEKAALLNTCKEFMESIKEEERNTETELLSLRREGERTLENERRVFRAGYEDRLQKYLSSKQHEYKESTARGMQSEFSRLQLMHDREMAEVDSWLHAEETQLHDRVKSRLQQRVDEERTAAQEELRVAVKAIHDRAEKEAEHAQKEHVRAVRGQQEVAERDLDKHRELLSEKSRKLRRSNQSELKGLQESAAGRLAELKAGHGRQVEELQTEHEEGLRRLRKQARDVLLLHTETSELSSDLLRLSVDEGSDGPSSRGSARSSPTKTKVRRSGGGGSSPRGNDSVVRKEAEAQRDKQLQNEIRSLETETLRLERSLKARAAEERSRIVDAQTSEETGNARRLRSLNDQMADVVLTREQLFRAVQEAQRRSDEASRVASETRREVQVYRDGIAAQRHRVKDREAVHRVRLKEMQLQSGPALRALRERCEQLEEELRRCERQSDEELRTNEKQHSAELADMDRQVTADVARTELEVSALREQIEAESVRRDKLDALVARYSGDASYSSDRLESTRASERLTNTPSVTGAPRRERAPFSTTHAASTSGERSSASSGRSVQSASSSGISRPLGGSSGRGGRK